MVVKDLILIKEVYEFFINLGISDWVSLLSFNYGDIVNFLVEICRWYRGVKEVDECLCFFVR